MGERILIVVYFARFACAALGASLGLVLGCFLGWHMIVEGFPSGPFAWALLAALALGVLSGVTVLSRPDLCLPRRETHHA